MIEPGEDEEGKLAALKTALRDVVKHMQDGKVSPQAAADEITALREALDGIIADLNSIEHN